MGGTTIPKWNDWIEGVAPSELVIGAKDISKLLCLREGIPRAILGLVGVDAERGRRGLRDLRGACGTAPDGPSNEFCGVISAGDVWPPRKAGNANLTIFNSDESSPAMTGVHSPDLELKESAPESSSSDSVISESTPSMISSMIWADALTSESTDVSVSVSEAASTASFLGAGKSMGSNFGAMIGEVKRTRSLFFSLRVGVLGGLKSIGIGELRFLAALRNFMVKGMLAAFIVAEMCVESESREPLSCVILSHSQCASNTFQNSCFVPVWDEKASFERATRRKTTFERHISRWGIYARGE